MPSAKATLKDEYCTVDARCRVASASTSTTRPRRACVAGGKLKADKRGREGLGRGSVKRFGVAVGECRHLLQQTNRLSLEIGQRCYEQEETLRGRGGESEAESEV